MQVIQTINDTIRILFSPIDEDFRLLDFLLVQEGENKYLAQIIEIYDDKYDASQNVARVKLFFKVNDNGEVFAYDHFTPSKECEIRKISLEEILSFINEGKESFVLGEDYATKEPLSINIDFLKNNAVIFADKIEHSNGMSAHFASALSGYKKHSVIFDFTGALDINNARKLKITKDIKLPLNFYTINYIWEKGLRTASLETQAICREIFNEVQTYAKSIPDGFIPFAKFLKVVEVQYKATPITELTVLLNKLKAYQKNSIFADSKKDFESIQSSCREKEITIIDFSELKTSWHKEFCDFIIRNLKDAFVFIRLNETNSDVDLINFIYDKNPMIHFIPSVSYSYSKMPHIIERADNFILLPTLSPRRDFGAANFELSSIAGDECILFGKDTENFIFTIRNRKLTDVDRFGAKEIRKIKLKLDISPNQPTDKLKTDLNNQQATNFDDSQDSPPVLTDEELEFYEQPLEKADFVSEEKILAKKSEDAGVVEQHCADVSEEKKDIQDTRLEENASEVNIKKDTADSVDNSSAELKEHEVAQENNENPTPENELLNDTEESCADNAVVDDTLPLDENVQSEQQESENSAQEIKQEQQPSQTDADLYDAYESDLPQETYKQEAADETVIEGEIVSQTDDNQDDTAILDNQPLSELAREISESQDSAELSSSEAEPELPTVTDTQDNDFDTNKEYNPLIESESLVTESKDVSSSKENVSALQNDSQDKTLVSFDYSDSYNNETRQDDRQDSSGAQDSLVITSSYSKEEIKIAPFQNILEEQAADSEEDNDELLSLEDLAVQSVENAFNEVIDSENNSGQKKPQKDLQGKLVVDEDVVIDLEKIKEHIDTEGASELPIFRNKSAKKEKKPFKAGDMVEHDKYGVGEVVKVINYANRSLLQINFKEVGKRLLDPDIANIREYGEQ